MTGISTCSSGSAASLVGTQGVGAKRFAEERVVSTGSWLGEDPRVVGSGRRCGPPYWSLRFAASDAEAATSGWLEGNAAFGRVSEKLGYRETGVSEISPRGTPVPHHDVRLDRARLALAGRGEIDGLDPAASRCSSRGQPIERNAAASD